MGAALPQLNYSLICRLRTERGWSCEELAGKAKLDRRTIDRIGRGQNDSHIKTAVAIAEALEVDVSEIIQDDESPSVTTSVGDNDQITAAFTAADKAIRNTLSAGGRWGAEEVTSVLALLLARYGSAFANYPNSNTNNVHDVVDLATDRARRALLPQGLDRRRKQEGKKT